MVAVSSFSRAAEWQLDQPAWSGRLRITAKGKIAFIKLEDKTSGKEEEGRRRLRAPPWGGRRYALALTRSRFSFSGELFAQAPVEQFPGIAVESVTDSSRYFVIRIEDGNGTSRYVGDRLGESPQKVFSALAALICEGFLLSRAKYSLQTVAKRRIISLPRASRALSFTRNKTSLILLLGVSVRTPLRAGSSP